MLMRTKLIQLPKNKINGLRNYTTKIIDYQYLQHSRIETSHFQRSLPKLPVPELSKTCERYLAALKPIIKDEKKYTNTVNNVKEFENGVGKKLHSELLSIDKKNPHTCYINKPWTDMYLKSRTPLVLNYNPFLAWKDDPQPEYNQSTIRASNFLISALRFRRSLNENKLKPEVFHLNPEKSDTQLYENIMRLTPKSIAFYASAVFKAYPLDMSQYINLFSSTRIPCLDKDRIVHFADTHHIIVLKNGMFYKFDSIDDNGDIKDPDYIHSCLKYINAQQSVSSNNDLPITYLTTEDRDLWAKAREKLITINEQNEENLRLIDSALFVICLDNVEYDNDLVKHSHNYLHGGNLLIDNVRGGELNRWFDKSLSVIFTKDGHAAINFEHSWGDGVAVLRFFNEIYNDSKNYFVKFDKKTNGNIVNLKNEVKQLNFTLNDELIDIIKQSKTKFINTINKLEINNYKTDLMSRDYFKKKKISPDSMFQLAFQMAFYRINGYLPVTYESCSTSAFKHGRTETVRSATNETLAACKAFLDDKVTDKSLLRENLDKCSKKHFQLTKEAALGQGFDRHLFYLKYLCDENKYDLPKIFTDENFTYANKFILSTSTLYGECFMGGGFAPVCNDGYGLGYGYIDSMLGVNCASYKPYRSATQLTDAFAISLRDIYSVLSAF